MQRFAIAVLCAAVVVSPRVASQEVSHSANVEKAAPLPPVTPRPAASVADGDGARRSEPPRNPSRDAAAATTKERTDALPPLFRDETTRVAPRMDDTGVARSQSGDSAAPVPQREPNPGPLPIELAPPPGDEKSQPGADRRSPLSGPYSVIRTVAIPLLLAAAGIWCVARIVRSQE
jgi:hypothetical protein